MKEVLRIKEVDGKKIHSTKITGSKIDKGGEFYIYNRYDAEDKIQALNEYCYVDDKELPFEKLTAEEELIINPEVVDDG